MSLKKYLVNGLIAFSFGAILFAGCAQPPTDKVNALQNEVKDLQAKGAEVFAADQFAVVSQQMSELQTQMDNKKYKEASALADSISAVVATVKTAVDSSATELTNQNIAAAKTEVDNFKAIVTPENLKALGEGAAAVQEQVAGFEAQVAGLDSIAASGALLDAYNSSMSIKDQVVAAAADVNAKVEAAKAAKPAKKGKK
jgi:hypothetical protein